MCDVIDASFNYSVDVKETFVTILEKALNARDCDALEVFSLFFQQDDFPCPSEVEALMQLDYDCPPLQRLLMQISHARLSRYEKLTLDLTSKERKDVIDKVVASNFAPAQSLIAMVQEVRETSVSLVSNESTISPVPEAGNVSLKGTETSENRKTEANVVGLSEPLKKKVFVSCNSAKQRKERYMRKKRDEQERNAKKRPKGSLAPKAAPKASSKSETPKKLSKREKKRLEKKRLRNEKKR